MRIDKTDLFLRRLQQLLIGNIQNPYQMYEFNVRYKPFSTFNSLDGIFVNVQSGKLQRVRKLSLGFPGFFSQDGDLLSAYVVVTVISLVNKHIPTTFDI